MSARPLCSAFLMLLMVGCLRSSHGPVASTVLAYQQSSNESSADRLSRLPAALVRVQAYCRQTHPDADAAGSAFVIGHADGWSYFVSARHVFFPSACAKDLAQRVVLRGEGVWTFDGDPKPLIVTQTSPAEDLILLRARGDRHVESVKLTMVVPDSVTSENEPIEAFGFSMLQGSGKRPLHDSKRGSLTSNLRDEDFHHFFLTNAKLLPSMSGGPVALRGSGLVFGVVLGEYEIQKAGLREGRIATLGPLLDKMGDTIRQRIGATLYERIHPAYLPDKLQPTWVERPEQQRVLALLDQEQPNQRPAKIYLHGVGGVGKTTLAAQVAALRKGQYAGGQIKLVIDKLRLDQTLAQLLEALTGTRPDPKIYRDWAKLVRAHLENRDKTLLILDNLQQEETGMSGSDALNTLLWAVEPATVVLTGRSRQAPTGYSSVELESLPKPAATKLVLGVGRQKGLSVSLLEASELADLLGGLPFALERAVELMHDDNESIGSLLRRLGQEGRDPHGRLAKLLEWSYLALPLNAQQVLIALGQLAEAPVPESLLTKLSFSEDLTAALRRLVRSGLVQKNEFPTTTVTYRQHTLLWEWARRLGSQRHIPTARFVRKRLVDMLSPDDASMAPLLLEHFLDAQNQAVAEQHLERVVEIAITLDRHLDRFGYWQIRYEFLTKATLAARRIHDRNHDSLRFADVLNRLGNAARALGLFAEADTLYSESKNLPGMRADDEKMAIILQHSAAAKYDTGHLAEALDLYQQSLIIERRINNYHGIARALNGIGHVKSLLGMQQEALAHLSEAMSILAKLDDSSEHQLTKANILNGMGNVYAFQKSYLQSKTSYEQALIILRKLKNLPGIAKILANMGRLATSLHNYTDSIGYFEESLTISRGLKDEISIVERLYDLGHVAHLRDDLNIAERYFAEVRSRAPKEGKGPRLMAKALRGLSKIATRQGNRDEAKRLREQLRDVETIGARTRNISPSERFEGATSP